MAKAKVATTHQDCWRRIGVWGSVFPRCEHLAEVIHCRNCSTFVDAGRSVFERKLPANYRDEWTSKLNKENVVEQKGTASAFVFRVGNEWYSLPAFAIDAIAEHKPVHRLPHINNKTIVGVANISGEILLCYSLEEILGIGNQDKQEKSKTKTFRRFLVAKMGGNRYVFSVDEAKGMARYDPAALKHPPSTVNDASKKYVLGTFDLGSLKVTAIDGVALGAVLEGAEA